MVTRPAKKAAIYARISKADSEVDKVENQINELRKIAATCGYHVVTVHSDDDISAYKGKYQRNGYIALLEGIKAGEYDVVMATEPARLTRGSAAELEVLQGLCVRSKAVIHTRAGGVVDPSIGISAALMAIMDVISGLEIETKIERQKARIRADYDAGLPTKGIRAFGWEPDRITIRESEAEVIREAVNLILHKGATTWAIAQKWNSLGIETDGMSRPRKSKADGEVRLPSKVWTSTTVRQILVRPRNAGILMNEGAQLANSQIQPIISDADYQALLKAIQGKPMPKGPKPQYLLGGILECPCGERMHASKSITGRKGKSSRSYKIYRCRLNGFDKSQSHATINMHIADDTVIPKVVTQLGLGWTGHEAVDDSKVKAVQTKLGELSEKEAVTEGLLIEGIGNSARLKGTLRKIQHEREILTRELETQIASGQHSDGIAQFQARVEELHALTDNPVSIAAMEDEIQKVFETGQQAWEELPMELRRAIIKANYRITVDIGGRGHERVTIIEKRTLKEMTSK